MCVNARERYGSRGLRIVTATKPQLTAEGGGLDSRSHWLLPRDLIDLSVLLRHCSLDRVTTVIFSFLLDSFFF